ncbi:MAG: peptidase MA family metallohydrolase [Gemmatimonadota bacterium]
MARAPAGAGWPDSSGLELTPPVRLAFGPGEPILLVAYAPRDRAVADRLAEVAAGFDPRLFAGTPAKRPPAAPDTVRLFLVPDEAAFRRASGGRLPDWGLALAFPASAAIVMRPPRLVAAPAQDPAQVLVHELAHVYLGLFLAEADSAAPRWLHEGLASLLAGEWGWSERLNLTFALVAGRILPLERLERGFPQRLPAAQLAYLESLSAAAYLRSLSGEEGLRILLRNLRRTGDMDAAMRRTYGITYAEFIERWETTVARRYGWAAAAASSWTTWSLAALAVILLVVVRRTRYRARLAELKRQERLNPPSEAAELSRGGSGTDAGEIEP